MTPKLKMTPLAVITLILLNSFVSSEAYYQLHNKSAAARHGLFGCCMFRAEYCKNWCNNRPCTDTCSFSCGFFNRFCGTLQCSAATNSCISSSNNNNNNGNSNLISDLRRQTGRVVEPGTQEFEELRKVFNAACTARPAVIVVPNSDQDVSHILKTAQQYNTPISVKSGGHSYTCNSLKEDSIHIVMKNFNKIELFDSVESETGKAAWLGTGATWGQILREIDPEVYSYPHGQCRSVGVGGFLLGGGVNWMGTLNKYGYGAESVIRMKAVLADGSIVSVDKDATTYKDGRVVQHTADNNLYYGLRGAGSSMAIVTEFLYIIHKEPETRPSIVMIWLEDEAALENMMKVMRNTEKYSFMVNEQISSLSFWTRPILSPLMKAFPLAMQALRKINGKRSFPVQVMVTDMTLGAGRTTAPLPAVQYLRDEGVDVLLDTPLNMLALKPLAASAVGGSVHYAFDKIANVLYEEIEKEQETWQPGVWSSISLNYGSLSSTAAFAKDFLDDQYTGVRRNIYLAQAAYGCEFCFWMLHFRNRQRQSALSHETPVSIRTDLHVSESVEINLTCMFSPSVTSCPNIVNGIRGNIDNRLTGTSYSKYVNFPSCSTKQGTDWRALYWGTNVPKLLKIKQEWDPKDMFNHCQSLTNTNPNCCPYTPV